MIWMMTMSETTSLRRDSDQSSYVLTRREGREGIIKREKEREREKKREKAVREQRSLERCYGYAPLVVFLRTRNEHHNKQPAIKPILLLWYWIERDPGN